VSTAAAVLWWLPLTPLHSVRDVFRLKPNQASPLLLLLLLLL